MRNRQAHNRSAKIGALEIVADLQQTDIDRQRSIGRDMLNQRDHVPRIMVGLCGAIPRDSTLSKA